MKKIIIAVVIVVTSGAAALSLTIKDVKAIEVVNESKKIELVIKSDNAPKSRIATAD